MHASKGSLQACTHACRLTSGSFHAMHRLLHVIKERQTSADANLVCTMQGTYIHIYTCMKTYLMQGPSMHSMYSPAFKEKTDRTCSSA